jgi:hypothetical protein
MSSTSLPAVDVVLWWRLLAISEEPFFVGRQE